ncbi:hypothetical protein E2R51_08075 [Jeotgalibacillus sp. S-D1]|uniref:hypothetical protein n=1 Tax=Jeotgalibacillus sp. S-D1 TaxID=2552189 RepID=UPI001059C062|nr:hypothetical protein [Jeotgalibacillus sp. S-D1]TDL32632.1 hypothetical protein E2R51_08075 [Jeotgalibacillus sp. S-D1]
MKDQEFILTVQYSNDQYSVQGSQSVIEHHIKQVFNHLAALNAQQADEKKIHIDIGSPSPEKRINGSEIIESLPIALSESQEQQLQSIVADVQPSAEWLHVLCFSYYLSYYLKETLITAKSINNAFDHAAVMQPGNIHLSIFQCVNKGFLQLIGTSCGKQIYQITYEGKKHIEERITYSEKCRNEDSTFLRYETEEQKKQAEYFIQHIKPEDYDAIKKPTNFEHKLLLILYYLYEKGISKPVRTAMIYQILVQLFQYKDTQRSVQTALSRARPLVIKIKKDNKIYYRLTKEGHEYVKSLV